MERISCCNDVMNHFDSVIKCDVYPQKMHLYSKDILDISFYFRSKNIHGISKKIYHG